jgi:hypothetical protein
MSDTYVSIPESALQAVGAKDADEFFAKVMETGISARAKAAEFQALIAKIGALTKAEVAARVAEIQPKIDAIKRELARLQPLVDAIPLMTPKSMAKIQTIAGDAAAKLCANYIPDIPLD